MTNPAHSPVALTDDLTRPPEPDHRVEPVAVAVGSALDPSVTSVAWVVRRLVGAAHQHRSEGTVDAARSLFRFLAEQVHLAGRTSMIVQISHDARRRSEPMQVFLGIGVLGPAEGVADEAVSVAVAVDALFDRPGLPFDVEPADFDDIRHSVGNVSETAVIRQRLVDIDDGNGGDVPVPMRFNRTVDPWLALTRLLNRHDQPVTVRVTALATEATVADRSLLLGWLRNAASVYATLVERGEPTSPVQRAITTLTDISDGLASPQFCGEILVASAAPLPERLVRAVATYFTSDPEVDRRPDGTVVAGSRIMRGGCEIQRNSPRQIEAMHIGLPLRGGLVERQLNDLLTLAELPVGWPVPIGAPVPGLPGTSRRVLPPPAAFGTEPAGGGLVVGRDSSGRSIWIDDPTCRRHLSIWGRTGCGKSALMVDMMRRDCRSSVGFVCIDPHDSSGRNVARYATQLGIDPVVVDIADERTTAIGWAPRLDDDGENLMDVEAAVQRFVDATVSHLPNDWAGPRFHQGATALLMAACAAGVDIPKAISAMAEASTAERLLEHPHLPEWVKHHVRGWFSRTNNDATSVREWIVSKFNAFVVGPARRLVSPPGSGTDLGRAVLDGRIVIVNLGGLADGESRMVGHLALSQVCAAVVRRGALDPQATPIRVYVDEAPTFYSHHLQTLMTGGRKFGASLVLSGQSPNQFDGVVADQAMATETQIAFAQTPAGGHVLGSLLSVDSADLVAQPDFHAFVKVGSNPTFTIDTPRYAKDHE